MTVTTAPPAGGALPSASDRPRLGDHRRRRGVGAQGHAGHPRRRAARHRDPAVLRPPAARPGRRLPAVPGRGRGPAQAAARPARPRSPTAWSSRTQLTSPVADKAQHGVMELLLINHPLDCPVCDKGGECPLQNQAMSNGRAESRFDGAKRTFPKPISISTQVLLDRERCVLCARCTRFSDADRRRPVHRAARARRAAAGRHLRGPAVQLLLLRQHRADLPGRCADQRGVPVPLPAVRPGLDADARASTAPPAARCAPTTAAARCCAGWPATTRQVNEEWNCDKGRCAFHYATAHGPPHARRWSATTDGALGRDVLARGARRRRPRPGRGAAAAASACWSAAASTRRGRLRLREVRPGRARHQRHRLPRPAALGRGGRRSSPRTSPARGLGVDLRRPRARARRCCSSASSPRRSRRSSSCGCARRRASAALRGARGRAVRHAAGWTKLSRPAAATRRPAPRPPCSTRSACRGGQTRRGRRRPSCCASPAP